MAADDALGKQFRRKGRGFGILPSAIVSVWPGEYRNESDLNDADADAGDAGAGDGGGGDGGGGE